MKHKEHKKVKFYKRAAGVITKLKSNQYIQMNMSVHLSLCNVQLGIFPPG